MVVIHSCGYQRSIRLGGRRKLSLLWKSVRSPNHQYPATYSDNGSAATIANPARIGAAVDGRSRVIPLRYRTRAGVATKRALVGPDGSQQKLDIGRLTPAPVLLPRVLASK